MFLDANYVVILHALFVFNIRIFFQAYQQEVGDLPADLTDKCSLLSDLLAESRADTTVKTYYLAFQRWQTWAHGNGVSMTDVFPAKPLFVALYLCSLVQLCRTASPINVAFYGIQWAHRLIGVPSPTDATLVKNVFEGAKRRLATPVLKKEPITPEILLNMYNSKFIEGDLMSQRFISACLLAYAGFLRISELLQIKRCDISIESCYMSLDIPKSKTDIYRDGNTVIISRTSSVLCPVRNLELYLEWADIQDDSDEFIFRNLCKHKNRYVFRDDGKPMSYTRFRELFIDAFKNFVPDIKRYGIHSLRSGGATTCANLGISDRLFKRHGRWRSETAKDGYVKDSLSDRLSVSANLGL